MPIPSLHPQSLGGSFGPHSQTTSETLHTEQIPWLSAHQILLDYAPDKDSWHVSSSASSMKRHIVNLMSPRTDGHPHREVASRAAHGNLSRGPELQIRSMKESVKSGSRPDWMRSRVGLGTQPLGRISRIVRRRTGANACFTRNSFAREATCSAA